MTLINSVEMFSDSEIVQTFVHDIEHVIKLQQVVLQLH